MLHVCQVGAEVSIALVIMIWTPITLSPTRMTLINKVTAMSTT